MAITRHEIVELARVLGTTRDHVVFTGGAMLHVLVTDPAVRELRPTYDVDVYVTGSARSDYYDAETMLRDAGFRQRADEPVCRWFKGDLVVDLMSDDPAVLGFTNSWYSLAAEHVQPVKVDDVVINVVSAPFFIATKLAAFDDPNRDNSGDVLASRDVEDIIAIVDGRSELPAEVAGSPSEVRAFLRERLASLIADPSFEFAVAGYLRHDVRRTMLVVERFRDVMGRCG